jgi:hypothetical protein
MGVVGGRRLTHQQVVTLAGIFGEPLAARQFLDEARIPTADAMEPIRAPHVLAAISDLLAAGIAVAGQARLSRCCTSAIRTTPCSTYTPSARRRTSPALKRAISHARRPLLLKEGQ